MKYFTLITLLVVTLFGSNLYSQETKYVIVPIQFDFLKGQDQFRANTLLRYLFKENGYQAYFDVEELPQDLFDDRCKAIYSDVKRIGGGLNIKVQIEIKDCRGNLLFLSDIGKSKEKDLSKGYKIAIEEAFQSFKSVNVMSKANELEVLIAKEEQEKQISQQKSEISESTVAATAVETSEKSKNIKSSEETTEINENGVPTLYAKKADDGSYQLIDLKPQVVMTIEKSDIADVYKVKGEDGILFKRGKVWIHAKTVDGKTIEKEYIVKF